MDELNKNNENLNYEIREISLDELEDLEEIVVPDNGSISCCNL